MLRFRPPPSLKPPQLQFVGYEIGFGLCVVTAPPDDNHERDAIVGQEGPQPGLAKPPRPGLHHSVVTVTRLFHVLCLEPHNVSRGAATPTCVNTQ